MQAKGTRLVKRDNGIFYVVWTGSSRGKSTGTCDRKVAEIALANHILRRDRASDVPQGLTVHQAIEDYLEEHVRPKVAAKERAGFAASYLRAHFSSRKRVVDVTEADLDAYLKARRNGRIVLKRENPKPAGDGSLRRELGTLNAAFRHAVRRKRIPREDVPHIQLPVEPAPKDRWLTVEEEKQLVGACQVETVAAKDKPARLTRIYRFLMLALETAARKEALETLTWLQVDFDVDTINFNPRGRAQTKKRRAHIKVSRRLRDVLWRAFQERTSGWVLDHDGSMRSAFRGLVGRARLEGVTPHTLRHTWATRAARAGVSLRDISDFLGDDVRTIERVYRHHHPDFLREAANWREKEQEAK